jgi:hypothetical protein
MPLIKQNILKGENEIVSAEVIPSGMTLTVKATLKNSNYDLVAEEVLTFSTPSVDEKVIIYLINDPIDPLEIVFGDASPTGHLVIPLCEFTFTPTTTDLEQIDIVAIEVIQ